MVSGALLRQIRRGGRGMYSASAGRISLGSNFPNPAALNGLPCAVTRNVVRAIRPPDVPEMHNAARRNMIAGRRWYFRGRLPQMPAGLKLP
jgi:hypothetical protein